MEVNASIKHLNHSVFSINAHLVLVTKYRKKCINSEVLARLRTIFELTLKKWECELTEFRGPESPPPDIAKSKSSTVKDCKQFKDGFGEAHSQRVCQTFK